MFIDSHAHIDGPEFDKDRDEIIQRAHDAGVETIIVIGSGDTIDVAHRALTLAKTQNNLFATVGIHPHDAVSIKQPWWDEFEQLALDPKVVGIGETGLDYHYDHSPREIQQDVFRRFIDLSQRCNKPVICHVRDAHDDAIKILRECNVPAQKAVIHCFTGTPEQATAYVDMGYYISFSGIVTFQGKNANPIREAVSVTPHDRLLLETDCPYLSPHPQRGKRNEPAFMVHTAQVVAKHANISIQALAEITTANAKTFFSLTL